MRSVCGKPMAEALAGRLARLIEHYADKAQAAKLALAVAGALCAIVGRTAADAMSALAAIEPELPGLLTTGDF